MEQLFPKVTKEHSISVRYKEMRVPMETNYIWTLIKQVWMNYILQLMSPIIILILPMKWEFYWSNAGELPSRM